MGKGWWRNEWLAQLAIAIGYAVVYVGIHPLSDAHWPLRSGLRLSCLLLLPYRYWPALLAAEAIPNAYEVIPCLDAFGLGFVAVRCIPPILFFMPIVWWCRERLSLFPAQKLVDVKIMMLCIVMITMAWTAYCYLAISFVHTSSFHAKPIMALTYFVGNYIAILCTVPIALMIKMDSYSYGKKLASHLNEKAKRLGKESRFRWGALASQTAIALAYALTYCAIRPISDAHWALTSGLRFTCLLLIPYRYWLALAVGESIPLAYWMFKNEALYGIVTASIWSIPPIVIAMPIVWFFRRHLGLFPSQRAIDMKTLLICALGTSMAWAVVTYAGFLAATDPTMTPSLVMFASVFIGSYVAILTITTWPLFFLLSRDSRTIGELISDGAKSVLAVDTWKYAAPLLLLIALGSMHGMKHFVRLAIGQYGLVWFLPILWITLRHGWRAAALGGALAITAICLATASRADLDIIEVQGLVALTCTFLLIIGARISVQLQQEAIARDDGIKLRHAAQRHLQISEQRRRQLSESLEFLAGTLYLTNNGLVQKLRRIMPSADVDSCYKQLVTARNEVYALAESQYPLAWRERGLPAALNETIGRALDEAGITYCCTIKGRGFTRISPVALSTTYRIACEAVTQVTGRLTCSRVYLTLRGGETNGRRWLVLRVKGIHDDEKIMNAVMRSSERQRIAVKLGASALDIDQLRMQTRFFDGVLHDRSQDRSTCLTILLQDAPHDTQNATKENMPLRLWLC